MKIPILVFCMLVGAANAANTYYVSKSTGLDTRTSTQAKSTATPWAHFPGMASCTSNCNSYSPVAGDTFVLMGCDVWVASDLPITWAWTGSAGNVITVGGADQTWYNATNCPSGWNRPVFDLAKSALSGDAYLIQNSSNGLSYVTFEYIEIKGLELTSGGGLVDNLAKDAVGFTFTKNYIHAWDATADNCVFFKGTYSAGGTPTATNIVYSYNVIDGSDRTGSGNTGTTGVCYGFYTNDTGTHVLNNVIRYVVNPFVVSANSTGMEIGGNWIDNTLNSIGGANHCNVIETNGGSPFYIHDNVISNFQCSGGETLSVGNDNNETSYVWNNVVYGIGSAQMPGFGGDSFVETGITAYFLSNTFVSPNGQNCVIDNSPAGTTGNLHISNMHCISTGSVAGGFPGGVTLTLTTNLLQTPTAADLNSSPHFDQYTSSETYAYSPLASTNSTVGAGTDLTSSWPGGYSTNDTQYGVTEQTISGVVQAVLGRTTNARGTWDIGAYQFTAGAASSGTIINGGPWNGVKVQ